MDKTSVLFRRTSSVCILFPSPWYALHGWLGVENKSSCGNAQLVTVTVVVVGLVVGLAAFFTHHFNCVLFLFWSAYAGVPAKGYCGRRNWGPLCWEPELAPVLFIFLLCLCVTLNYHTFNLNFIYLHVTFMACFKSNILLRTVKYYLKCSLFKTWSKSQCSHACFAHCRQKVLPCTNLYLPCPFTFIFFQILSLFFNCVSLGSLWDRRINSHSHKQFTNRFPWWVPTKSK